MRALLAAPWRALSLPALLLILLVTASGCAIRAGTEKQLTERGKKICCADLAGKRIWFRRFDHQRVSDVSHAFATGSGGSASGTSVTTSAYSEVPPFVLTKAQETDLFEQVSPFQGDTKPPLILEGSMHQEMDTPWWTWVQALDLLVHAWVFPTLGKEAVFEGEIRLYDGDYKLLHTWTYRYEQTYLSVIWWGGAEQYAEKLQSLQPEVAQWVFDEIGKRMSQTPAAAVISAPAPDPAPKK
jgi:hypothetical protein